MLPSLPPTIYRAKGEGGRSLAPSSKEGVRPRGGRSPSSPRHPGGAFPLEDSSLPRDGGSPQIPSGWRPEGERGEARLGWALGPICPRVCPLPLSPAPWAPCGRRTSPPRGWSLPTLGPRSPLGPVAPPGGPPGPSRWSRYVTDSTRNFSGDQNRTSHI